MGKPWEEYRGHIYELYIAQNLPLKQVQEILKERYGFDACKRAFQNQIEAWGFRKNVRSSEMQVYVQQKKLRKSDSEIDLPDETKKIITPRKARRFEKRSETLGQQKSTPLDLDPAALNSAGLHHHHGMQSPVNYPNRMSGYGNYNYPQDLSGQLMGSPSFGTTTAALPNMTAESRSPYHSNFHINTTMPTVSGPATYTTLAADSAPMFDLTDDFAYNSSSGMYDLPSGIMKKEQNTWFLQADEPSQIPYTTSFSANPLDDELFNACLSGLWKEVPTLIRKGADVNGISYDGETVLTVVTKNMCTMMEHAAASANNATIRSLLMHNKVLDILIKSGANVYQRNRLNESPIEYAHSRHYVEHQFPSPETFKQWNFFVQLLDGGARQMRNNNAYQY